MLSERDGRRCRFFLISRNSYIDVIILGNMIFLSSCFTHHSCVQVESLLSVDRLEAPLQSIISDLERSERGRGGRGGGGGGGEARRRRRSKGTTRKSNESKGEEKNQACDCGSMLERLGAKLDAERGEILETRLTQHDVTLTTQLDLQTRCNLLTSPQVN